MNGILVVDKPSGWTSFDVIAKLRGALQTRKIGHTGTLDPLATGVLVLFVGPAARAEDLPQNSEKCYEATVRFGIHTPTGDLESEPDRVCPAAFTRGQLEEALRSLTGPQLQKPPMYSAVKIHGRPLYKSARAGVEVERPARPVTVYAASIGGKGPAENEWRITVSCSRGTYVRVFAETLGERLGTAAALSALRRTASGDFTLGDAHPLPEILAAADRGEADSLLLPTDTLFRGLPRHDCAADEFRALYNGSSVPLADSGLFRVYRDDLFAGIGEAADGTLRMRKLLCGRLEETGGNAPA